MRNFLRRSPTEKVHTETNWVMGWKQANVYLLDDLRTLNFVPIHQDGVIYNYGVDDDAKCQQWTHSAPDDGCACGFNAWDELEIVWLYKRAIKQFPHKYPEMAVRCLALLYVGLYGDLIDATLTLKMRDGTQQQHWGYRSSKQRVSDIFFEQKCAACDRTDVSRLGLTYQDSAWGWSLKPLCSVHLEEQAKASISPVTLARHNDVGIHWNYPSE